MAEALWEKARIRINCDKTRVWNRAGVKPVGVEAMGAGVWVGDHSMPTYTQGMNILGLPLGHEDDVKSCLSIVQKTHEFYSKDNFCAELAECVVVAIILCEFSGIFFHSRC